MINLFFVDDHRMVVESLSKLIEESGVAHITKMFYDIESCRNELKINLPDILLLDIELPDGDGVEFCAEVKKDYPELGIIMLTTYKECSIAKRAMQNGALGYILKNSDIEDVIEGIKTVYNKKQYLCKEIKYLLRDNGQEDVIWLSGREKEVLQYMSDGKTTKEIAKILFVDTETIKTYRKRLLDKTNSNNTAEMIKKSITMRLIH